jgi:hypothetical protein
MRHALGVKDADNARLRAEVKMQAETQQQMLKELDQMAVDWRRDVLLSRKVWNAAIAVTRKRKGRVFAGEDVHGAGAARPSSAASQNNQKHRRAAAVDIGPSAHPREREREREREQATAYRHKPGHRERIAASYFRAGTHPGGGTERHHPSAS